MMGGGPHQGSAPSPRLATASFPPVRPDDAVKPGEAFIPPTERGIDTSSGGEAGMAGVGRRGFAAAARAAMFVAQGPRPMGPQAQPHYIRKQMVPQHLDLNAAALREYTVQITFIDSIDHIDFDRGYGNPSAIRRIWLFIIPFTRSNVTSRCKFLPTTTTTTTTITDIQDAFTRPASA